MARKLKSDHVLAALAELFVTRDELLNETLFLSLTHARVEIAAWVED